ncbi:MAG: hypothetical protein OES15_00770 [Nitrosopumilus sp.]|nr:hypothetical protein [Nitrosopumilus sp.]MDH3852815.1 hypothetical protein [Nitrosopumilus sp.]
MKEKYSNQKKLLLTELERLQRISGHMHNFDVVWFPQNNSEIEGKVEGNTITIYSQNITDAIDTLQHEFVDYIISQVIKPYITLVNSLMGIITKEAYETKEKSVEALLNLINSSKK